MSEDITQTRIRLRKLKVAEFASEDTLCYSAIVLFDGKPIAHARNDGHGGCTIINALEKTSTQLAEAEAFAKSLPAVTSQYQGENGPHSFTLSMDLEFLVDRLASELHLRSAFNRDIANKVMFIRSGKLLQLKGIRLGKIADRPKLFQSLREQHGAEVILAELPRETAFQLWKTHATSGR